MKNFNRIFAFGDSFVVGDQDEPTQNIEHLKYNVSFVSILAKQFNVPLTNDAVRGSSNFAQIDKLWMRAVNGELKETDLILFGITTPVRERCRLLDLAPNVLHHSIGECIVDRQLINNNNLMWETDYFYALSILESIERKFGLTILKFNIFDNILDYASPEKKQLFEVPNFIDFTESGNTLVDILHDTYGQPVVNPYHTRLDIKPGYEYLFTHGKHPSPAGHDKIAKWFYNYITQ